LAAKAVYILQASLTTLAQPLRIQEMAVVAAGHLLLIKHLVAQAVLE
jgi:hypothetical protein